MRFQIATAPSKLTKRWKNQLMEWADLLQRLEKPVRTGETVAEYWAMDKPARDSKKDVGGFVGGYLNDGLRKHDTVRYRGLVCLDADSITVGFDFVARCREALGDYEWAVYTTHSHRPEKPRFRLVVPLWETIPPDAYEPLARKLAAKIGIEVFDPTTYQVHRLMYFPSASTDGEYIYEHNESSIFLKGETVLAEYENWRDASAWPTAQSEAAAHQRELKKLGDPREKHNVVGAFCRAYSIEEAMTAFLPDVYSLCDVPGRYTYNKGSTTGGVVIYDDGLFAFSHHATDPISGQDVNAFDLVRLNLFKDADEGTRADCGPTRLPSYRKMVELALKDEQVRIELAPKDEDYDDSLLTDAPEGEEKKEAWRGKLQYNEHGVLTRIAENFILIVANDKGLKGAFGVDDFSHRVLLKKDLPWRKRSDGDDVWRDSDDAQLRNYISRKYNGLSNRALLDDAWQEVCQLNRFHQVREWLEALPEWDGETRAESLLVDFLGAEDTEYVRTLTRLFFKAAVARVFKPGTKFDNCLVLTGPQGIGKSTVLAAMGGRWFNDSIVSLQGKDVLEQLQGSLVVELAEMQAANRAENDMIKAFISRQVDKFRAPYGRRTEEYKRQCVFAATTNEDIFLKDRTGGRRFWIIAVPGGGAKRLEELTQEYIGQVWAELWQLYKDDKSLLPSKEVLETLRSEQESRTEGDEKKGIIQGYLDTPIPTDWKKWSLKERQGYFRGDVPITEGEETMQRDRVCVLEIWCECFGSTRERMKNMDARELNTIMQHMPGWRKYEGNKAGKFRFDELYGVQRAFMRVSTDEKQYPKANDVADNVADYDDLI